MTKLTMVGEDAEKVVAKYPMAYCCCDEDGFYIVKDFETREEVGRGKKPIRAWHDAAKKLHKKKKGLKRQA